MLFSFWFLGIFKVAHEQKAMLEAVAVAEETERGEQRTIPCTMMIAISRVFFRHMCFLKPRRDSRQEQRHASGATSATNQ